MEKLEAALLRRPWPLALISRLRYCRVFHFILFGSMVCIPIASNVGINAIVVEQDASPHPEAFEIA
jgi:hypothetical protein